MLLPARGITVVIRDTGLVFRQSSIDRFLKLEVLGIQEIPASATRQLKMDGTLVVRLLHGKTHSTIRQSRNPIGFQDGPIWLIL